MVGTEHQAPCSTLKKVFEGINLFGQCILTSDIVIQPKNQKGICVRQYSFIDGELKSRLVNALKHRHNLTGDLTDKLLEWRECPEEQLQRSRDALLKLKWV